MYVCTCKLMQSSVSHDPQDVDSATCMLRMTEVTHTHTVIGYIFMDMVGEKRTEHEYTTRRDVMFVCHMCTVAPQTHVIHVK